MSWWQKEGPKNWSELLKEDQPEIDQELRDCTYAGRPFGTKELLAEIGKKIGRTWVRGRPSKKKPQSVSNEATNQFELFGK